MKKLLEERGKWQTKPRNKLFLIELQHVVGLFFGGQSLIVYQMEEILFGTWKHARNSCSDRRSIGCSNLRHLTLASFQPPFQGLPFLLEEAIPLLTDMLSSSGLCENLRVTTQLLESITHPIHCLAMPQLYNKKPRRTKNPSLNGPSKETYRSSLLTNNRKENSPYCASMTVAGRNT